LKSKISDDEIPSTQEVMSDRSRASTRRLQTAVLRSVSRSFYLSIRFLPVSLREPVALAYLLARTTDTVADTPRISGTLRVETLQTLSKAIQGKASRSIVDDLVASFAPLQQDAAERTLIESLPDCLEGLEHLDMSDGADVRAVLEKITQGQMLDLKRFGDPAEIAALPTAADLDEYTFLVAGCVGEFWTRLCFRHVRRFATLSEEEMLRLGKRYGVALQLINILRDAGSDLRAGRCYFPEEELTAAGMTAAQILFEPERFQPIHRNWAKKAERGLECGMQYSRAIRNRRIRAATVLPALIGARTLTLLHEAGAAMLDRRVKVSRRYVRGIIASLAITLASHSRIDAIFGRAKLLQSSPIAED
jgi:farnesyl-diphosphate farnesyltransferase